MTEQEIRSGEIVDDDSLEQRDALGHKLAGLWWTFLLRGLLAACVGVGALFWPTRSISLLLRLVCVLLSLDGGLTLLGFGRQGLCGGIGIGAALIGLILLIWPEGVARLAFFLLGAWALIYGMGAIVAWRQMHDLDPQVGTVRNSGIVAILIGLVLMFWPVSGLVALGWAIAFSALAFAAVMFWMAVRFRRAGDRLAMRVVNR